MNNPFVFQLVLSAPWHNMVNDAFIYLNSTMSPNLIQDVNYTLQLVPSTNGDSVMVIINYINDVVVDN